MTNQKAHDALIKARTKLMKGHVGMASMLLHLDLVEVSPETCKTMSTDGKHIFYCPEFVMEIDDDELRGVLVHEALHVAYEHMLRRGKRHHSVWNIACDYAINGHLLFDLKMNLPKGGLWANEYRGMTSEAIYALLVKDEDKLQNAIDDISQGQSETLSQTSTGEKVGDISLDDIPVPAGQILEPTDDNGKPLSDAAMSEMKGQIQRAVSLADKLEKAMSKDGTSGMSNSIEELKQFQVDWKSELSDFLQSTVADDNSWSRLNRRHQWRGINLPSKAKSPQGGELAVAIDTSGSVSQAELSMFATEIQAMAVDCGLDKIRVCYCDTTVRKNEQGEWWDIYALDEGDNLELKVRGGGGTRFDPPFNLFNDYTDDAHDVQAFIYFTDGWGRVEPESEPDVPVIWCLTDESFYSEGLPFGEKLYVDTSSLY